MPTLWRIFIPLLMLAPTAFAHDPPGPVITCQGWWDGNVHDYLPPSTGAYLRAGDGNLEECGTTSEGIHVLNDNSARCQQLKQIRDDPAHDSALRQTASDLHILLCTPHTILWDRTADYDGELDYGFGGVVLAVNSGDGATWGAQVCYGMDGHHSSNILALEWSPGGVPVGPPLLVTADYSRTPPPPGPKGPVADCGDNIVEPCNTTPPPPSTQPFPINVVVDTVNAQVFALFGPSGSGLTCNNLDCTDGTIGVYGAPSFLATTCPPGIDGTYQVYASTVATDNIQVAMTGHIWTI